MPSFWLQNGSTPINANAAANRLDLVDIGGQASQDRSGLRTLTQEMRVTGLDATYTNYSGNVKKTDTVRQILWVLDRCGLIPCQGQTLVDWDIFRNQIQNVGEDFAADHYDAWFCTNREVEADGNGNAKVKITWTYFEERVEFGAILKQVRTSQVRYGPNYDATLAATHWNNQIFQDTFKYAYIQPWQYDVVTVQVPIKKWFVRRNYNSITALRNDLDAYFGKVNSVNFDTAFCRQVLVNGVEISTLGGYSADTSGTAPFKLAYNVVWSLEDAGVGQTHDPILTVSVMGTTPDGVVPLKEWDKDATPMYFDASSEYWSRNGIARQQYYYTADLNGLTTINVNGSTIDLLTGMPK